MKTLLLSIVLSLTYSLTKAQQVKPIYFSGDKIVTKPTEATSYGVVGKLSTESIYVLKKYDLDNNLQMSGEYKDEILTVPHGNFFFYNDVMVFNSENRTDFSVKNQARFLSQRGAYVNALEQGSWFFYYPDGSIRTILKYKDGFLNGETIEYSPKGKITSKGLYINDKKSGTWYDLKKQTVSIYENDNLISKKKLSKAEILTIE